MTKPQTYVLAVPILAFLATCINNAHAQCAVDHRLTALRDQTISQRFPALANSPPPILVCDATQFPPGVAGIWDGNAIRIPDWSLRGDQNLAVNISHELAHAVAQASGCQSESDQATNRHGRCFLRELLKAGMTNEAHRVANQYGAMQALAEAQGQTGGYGGGLAAAPSPRGSGHSQPIYTAPQQCWIQREIVGEHCGRRGCRQVVRDVQVCQ